MRNAVALDYPIVESITSALPLCDEFIVAAGDSSDGTDDLLQSIGSPKLKVIRTRWDPALCVKGAVFAQQTDIALAACTGDWAFYLQGDEVIHERFLPVIESAMRRHLGDRRVEGLLFDYLHFFGDYDHVQSSHNWYGREVRVVRPGIGVQSWHDAQGFRRGGRKLSVIHSGACVFHYGWVCSPERMRTKAEAFDAVYRGAAARGRRYCGYGRLWGRERFHGTHPAVMQRRIQRQNWTVNRTQPAGHKHDRVGVQLLSLVENYILGFRVGERRNYVLLSGEENAQRGLAWRRWVAVQ